MIFKTRLKTSKTLIELTPLVDVVFLMLIFFIITSNVLPLKSLNVENPSLAKNSEPLTTQLLVVMDAQQVIYVGNNKEIIDPVACKKHLTEEIAQIKKYQPGANPTIVLSIDRRVDYGAFLKLFALAQECNSNIRLMYQTEDSWSETTK